VREIAHQCGFTDEAYFNRRFRQWVGTTPRSFRRDHVVGTRA
jgi:AraC-like DNA-binding protein